ncbi:MAG: hypothetical protein NVV83_16190 [Afipia sp.]|nr:hypothetical protein [Afipia sp.]
MTKLTNDQIEFARSMTIKQRTVLKALAMHPWFMSASERADPELYELIRHKFVQCNHTVPTFVGGLPSWGVTEQGARAAKRLAEGAY